MVRLKGGAVLAALSALLLCGKGYAQTSVWTGADAPGNQNWSDSNNWDVTPNFDDGDIDGPDQPSIDAQVLHAPITSLVDLNVELDTLFLNGGGPGNDIILSGPGALQIDTAITINFNGPSSILITVPMSGEAELSTGGGGTLTLAANNTYSGGTTISDGTLLIGTSTSGSGVFVSEGPVGTGTLFLNAGSSLGTTDSSSFFLGNNINLYSGGTVTLLGGSFGMNLALEGDISGPGGLEIAPPGNDGTNTIGFYSGNSTFSGNLIVDAGATSVLIGTSSSGSPSDVSSGPLGTGTVTLSSGNNLTTADDDFYELGNDIILSGGGTVSLIQNTFDTTLELDGVISGSSTLEIFPGSDGVNEVIFTNPNSTFTGGVTVDPGNTVLAIGASSEGTDAFVTSGPLGTGLLTLGSGTNFTTIDSGSYEIGNSIQLSGSGGSVELLGGGEGATLELDGTITGGPGSPNLVVNAGGDDNNIVILTSPDSTFQGGVSINGIGTTLLVGASSTTVAGAVTSGPLGLGALTLGNGTTLATLDGESFEIDNDIVLSGGGTVNLMTGSGDGTVLTLGGAISGSSALEINSGEGGNSVAFTSPNSTFTGGVIAEPGGGTIMIGASSSGSAGDITAGPLGTGTLTLGDGSNLTTVDSSPYEIDNDIALGGSVVQIMNNTSGGNLTLGGNISGFARLELVASFSDVGNMLTLTNPGSTFQAGISVLSGNTTLVVGASSVGPSGDMDSGPLGTGTLMLSDGNNFTVTEGGSFQIANAITLCGGGTVTLLGNLATGGTLELDGPISGSSSIEIAAPQSGSNTTILASTGSTFSGGVTVDAGANALVVAASGFGAPGDIDSSPLGTGILSMGNGTVLMAPPGVPVTILNDIELGDDSNPSHVALQSVSSGMLTLMGSIQDFGGPGSLAIFGPLDLEGDNFYSGGTTINSTTVTAGSEFSFGFGPVTVNSSTINVTNMTPVIEELTMNGTSTINFAPGSTPALYGMLGDTLGSNNMINLGNGADTELTISVEQDPKYFGTINGNGSLVVTTTSSGSLELYGANTYNGGTTLTAFTVVVASNSSALGTGPVTLGSLSTLGIDHGVALSNAIVMNDEASIGGYGTINPSAPQTIPFQNGSLLVGGLGSIGTGDPSHLAIGTLSFGTNATVELGQSGVMQFSIMNPTGTPGTDFSAINAAGTVNITADNFSPFTVQIVGVASDGLTIGNANSFNPMLPYTWTLLSAGTLTGNLSPTAFIVDSTTFFGNSTNGGFFTVTESSTDLMLNFTPVPEPSTWALMACGLCGAAALGIRRRRRA